MITSPVLSDSIAGQQTEGNGGAVPPLSPPSKNKILTLQTEK